MGFRKRRVSAQGPYSCRALKSNVVSIKTIVVFVVEENPSPKFARKRCVQERLQSVRRRRALQEEAELEVEGEGGSTGADTYIPLQKSGTFFLHF